MGFGSFGEYMIFPIIDIVRKEIRNQIMRGELSLETLQSHGIQNKNVLHQTEKTEKNIIYEGALLTRLESNDFDLTLEKNDPSNPNRLTGVVIKYGEDLWQTISLIRFGGKLTNVKITVTLREPISDIITNPFGMGGSHFVEYVRNKRILIHYDTVASDPESSPEEVHKAETRIIFLENRNQEIRNLYGIPIERDLYYHSLAEYIDNPLGMESVDFLRYCLNIRTWWAEEATQEEKEEAHQSSIALREKYNISEEDTAVFQYEDLKGFMANPLGMFSDEFTEYVANREELSYLDTTNPSHQDRIDELVDRNGYLLGKFFTVDEYSLSFLKEYLDTNLTEYKETTLLRIMIDLIYDNAGKLASVKSETFSE